ncbi:nucleotidyltransferase family protein [Agromyces sp. C10]|uniref:nucleotidyltransferase family protein n=1 Tax=Agromyces sp. C10 TaxID=2935077 RepID=UPI00200A727C|nr:nucleotidyltransferase family protein [Agromyces sp. C10]MCK8610131.1 nucleotidyltransferase family protein [Agromyces sp. C10]
MNEFQVDVPLAVRLRLGHAAMQHLADSVGVDLLHIKGAAVDPELRPVELHGTDIDVLVRPAQFATLDRTMRRHGWRLHTSFQTGSPFGHAQTYLHETWGYVDVHRFFPGVRLDPDAAFERLWDDRRHLMIAAVSCAVPDTVAQSALLILNVARARGANASDLDAAWHRADAARRSEIEALVAELRAEVGFAAALGDLERFRGERDYALWKAVSTGGTRAEEWWGRVRAAPTLSGAVGIVLRAPLVNVDHLQFRLGRRPTRGDVAKEFLARPARALAEAWQRLRRGGAGR